MDDPLKTSSTKGDWIEYQAKRIVRKQQIASSDASLEDEEIVAGIWWQEMRWLGGKREGGRMGKRKEQEAGVKRAGNLVKEGRDRQVRMSEEGARGTWVWGPRLGRAS